MEEHYIMMLRERTEPEKLFLGLLQQDFFSSERFFTSGFVDLFLPELHTKVPHTSRHIASYRVAPNAQHGFRHALCRVLYFAIIRRSLS